MRCRDPFIVEGVIIGVIGAIIAFVVISYGYGALQGKFDKDLTNITFSFIKLLPLDKVVFKMLAGYIVLGMFVGAAGSAMSIRKHLRV